jgi:branched-chain amino acid transport system ATP-binding protein
MMLLEVKNLTVEYGAVRAINDVSFCVEEGEIVAMIGPNGAGKSTSLKAISGQLDHYGGQIVSGEITYKGHSIVGIRTDQLVRQGIALVPEGRRVFPSMTVRENLEMGAYIASDRRVLQEGMDRAFNLFPQLGNRMRQKAGTLSGGEQQMLAIGRALMLKPRLLLADEPSLGLSPNYSELLFEKFAEINAAGVTLLIVEQNALMALEIAHRAYVFNIGKIAASDSAANLLNDQDIKKAILG